MLTFGVVEQSYRMSPMQQGMLYHGVAAAAPRGAAEARAAVPPGQDLLQGVDINQLVCSPNEDLDAPALLAAFERVASRHAILRTAFRWSDVEEPLQDVYRDVRIPFEERDFRSLPEEAREAAFFALLDADRRRAFDLARPPLMRLTLVRLEERRYKILWTFHHAYLDGRSFYTVLTEVFAFYDAARAGRTLELPLPRPFRDYIDWLATRDWSRSEAFWRDLLKGFTAPTPIPIEHSGGPDKGRTVNEMSARLRVPLELTERLRARAAEGGLTLNNVVQGAWAILIARYAGQRDVVFGAARACRRSGFPGAESIVGLMINTVPVRVRFGTETTVLDLLKDLRSQWVAMRDHEHTPLAQVMKWSDLRGERALFNSLMVTENYNWKDALAAEGEPWRRRDVEIYERTTFPLTLLVDLGREIDVLIQYDGRRYTRAAIDRALGHLSVLFEAMASTFEQRVDHLPILTAEEQARLVPLRSGSLARSRGQSGACIHHLFEAQAARTPDATAVEAPDGELTYQELNLRANRLAHYLLSSGLRLGEKVGICEARSVDLAVAVLAVLKAGGAYVPLDPAYPPDRLAFMASDAGLAVVLTKRARASRLAKVSARLCVMDEEAHLINAESDESPRSPVSPSDTAYLVYTSGSTGTPKGVVALHRNIVRHTISFADEFDVGPSDRFAQFASISFDVMGLEMYPTWMRGGTVVMRPDDAVEPRSLERWIERAGVTCAALTTALWHEWVTVLEASGSAPPASLRLLCVGGEIMSRAAFDVFQRAGGAHVRLINIYGPTEATIYITYFDPRKEAPLPPGAAVPIGRGYPGAKLYVLDAQSRPAPIGVPGELFLGGPQIAAGYHNRPELTAERFLEDPTSPGERLYKTGDRVRIMDDGQLQFLGRADRQVKIRGYRIELPEIEAAIDKHPDVRHCAVVVVERSAGDRRVVAYVAGARSLSAEGLRSHLREILPSYMIPASFVIAESLPLTPNGKVDRDALTPLGADADKAALQGNEAPRTFMERILAEVFCDVLGVPSVGARESFFDLGGHSLLMLRLIDRAAHAGLFITPGQLIQHPNVAELAAVVTTSVADPTRGARVEEGSDPWSSLVPLRTTGKRPPLFLVHPPTGDIVVYARLVSELGSDQPCYGFQARGLRRLEDSHTSVEEMASYYVGLMRGRQPSGPYYIGGWCFGGVVAVEMAHQLRRAGQRVALVALIDARAPRPPTLIHGYYLDKIRALFALDPRQQARYVREKFELLRGRGAATVNDLLQVEFSDGPLANRGPITLTNRRALSRYCTYRYPGTLTLLNAMEPPKGAMYSRTMGWSALAEGLDIYEIAVSHSLLFREPHVKTLAASIRRSMDKAGAAVQGDDTSLDESCAPPSPPTLPSRAFTGRIAKERPSPPVRIPG